MGLLPGAPSALLGQAWGPPFPDSPPPAPRFCWQTLCSNPRGNDPALSQASRSSLPLPKTSIQEGKKIQHLFQVLSIFETHVNKIKRDKMPQRT